MYRTVLYSDYDKTFPTNLSTAMTNLIDKNIIHSEQYISDEDVNISNDGPESYWHINLLCIEKTDDDYIFHVNSSFQFHSYGFPGFDIVSKFSLYSEKLSDLKNKTNIIYDMSLSYMRDYLYKWRDYLKIYESDDEKLVSEMKILASKLDDIDILYNEKCISNEEQKEVQYRTEQIKDELIARIRNNTIKKDLIAEFWKPSRVERMLEKGGWKLVEMYIPP